jgi:hypothetical protein
MNPLPCNSEAKVVIEGDGIAAVCCARLLSDAGILCIVDRTPRPKLAAVLLGEQSQYLLRDLFPADELGDIFAGFPRIRRRIVRWGAPGPPLNLAHHGVVVSEEELLRRLWLRVPNHRGHTAAEGAWRIFSSRGSAPTLAELICGHRQAQISRVQLRDDAEPESCWTESVSNGWLFLLSLGKAEANLICVAEDVDRALGESTLIRNRIHRRSTVSAKAMASPRILQPLASETWLACGTAALSFDPLCGEGTGNAVREAYLAAAVVRAAIDGGNSANLTYHYQTRLTQGFLRHLQICHTFYSSGGVDSFWMSETEAINEGLRKVETMLGKVSTPQYSLQDRTLVPVQASDSSG